MPKATEISEPPIGSVNTRQVGEPLLRQGKYVEHDAIRVLSPTKVSWAYTVHPGLYLKHGEDSAAEFFVPAGGSGGGHVQKAALADNWKSIMVRRGERTLCMVTVFNAYGCGDPSNFERQTVSVESEDSFQQTLIYSGRVGNKINIGYREFSSSAARPAFNNDVEYDLSESSVIGYRGARLEVQEATNEHIRYRVISNFNRAAF
jgi:hypothetical protein